MLTVIDAVCLAGSRTKQNDDALGWTAGRAFVFDGATDLHDAPLTPAASDAAWIARFAVGRFMAAPDDEDLASLVRRVSAEARAAFDACLRGRPWPEPWMLPIASMMAVTETADGLAALNLGDCRLFALDAAGQAQTFGAAPQAKDEETAAAARLAAPTASGANYRSPEALAVLRAQRAAQNAGATAVFGVFPDCADLARAARLVLPRPAFALLATDGFAALCDAYGAYSPQAFVEAALEEGLAALAEELRAIETADDAGARHPRWKRSDDATAILVRLD